MRVPSLSRGMLLLADGVAEIMSTDLGRPLRKIRKVIREYLIVPFQSSNYRMTRSWARLLDANIAGNVSIARGRVPKGNPRRKRVSTALSERPNDRPMFRDIRGYSRGQLNNRLKSLGWLMNNSYIPDALVQELEDL